MPLAEAVSLDAIKVAAASPPGRLVVLHFWAAWCEPCKHMDKVMAQLAEEHPQAAFMRVEAEEVDAATIHFEVATVPTFVFFKDGRAVDRLEGADAAELTAKTAAATGAGAALKAPAAPAVAAAAAGANGGAAAAPPPGGGVEGRIKWLLTESPVMLFMKGTPEAPRCGFSSKVVAALQSHSVAFRGVDILADQELRDGVKAFSSWPTYPQLYVRGELVGGCDIILEMQGSGELGPLLKAAAPPGASPTPAAVAAPAPVAAPAAAAAPVDGVPLEARLKSIISQQPVVLFMKGNPEEPRCGFSRKVVEALQGASISFGTFDILQDNDVREGMKAYSNWPTFPQLYVKGELLGGCDIVLQMQEAGELTETIQSML